MSERSAIGTPFERNETSTRFKVLPGRTVTDPAEAALFPGFVGKPLAYYVRSEQARGMNIATDPLGTTMQEMFGREVLDFIIGPDSTSNGLREAAESLAATLNSPEFQKELSILLERKRHLEEAIRVVEQDIESRGNTLGSMLGGERFRMERYELVKDDSGSSW